MKRYKFKLIAIMLSSLSFFLILEATNAQNLPKVQESSVHAPSNIKIDGKLNEWNNGLQAYNPINRIFYTVSNDNEKLYLTIHTDDYYAVTKITSGGITFTTSLSTQKNNNEKAKDINNIAILYPIKVKPVQKGMQPQSDLIGDALWNTYLEYNVDTVQYKKQIDSLMNIANNEINLQYKGIQVTGIPEVTDNPVSIYNLLGIQVAAAFDYKLAFTYELAIPLKYLMLSEQNQPFSYNIKLSDQNSVLPPNEMPAPIFVGTSDPNVLYTQSTTDLWGEYTLK
ncbi:hypothetical protein [Albibacterium bauzanense]|uniref:Uncharacterized protein n=1 Tax=Albibacterium bauzanense TaxID=653929 RepID=A0A4R1M4X5_9SPHI|nr:hypothetical protein [Albibacterium bauzanense]TCK84783.1 hypothetical protein C8N28_0076 [Albibacterium bauzanense]